MLVRLPKPLTVLIGRQGSHAFYEGWYAYVGSARQGFSARLPTVMSPRRRKHWHIDYLVPHAADVEAWVLPTSMGECELAATLSEHLATRPWPRAFGATDCRCPGHLIPGGPSAEPVRRALRSLGLQPWKATKRP